MSSWKISMRRYFWNKCKHVWKSGRPENEINDTIKSKIMIVTIGFWSHDAATAIMEYSGSYKSD